ncbi:hypothetical protein SAY86_032090 [Trapa natans]|uniref:Uncharacterized protein n=1 Tax=Trapa natans TaxID=22666 RepID=A0AAN7M4G8_TRANT|nr:hypothetical protein SAY86_032090 [Trapa natans]
MELVCPCNTYTAYGPPRQSQRRTKPFFGSSLKIRDYSAAKFRKSIDSGLSRQSYTSAVTKGSAEPSKSEETLPSWAQPNADEPPPWAREEGQGSGSQESFKVPFAVYLLASAVTAIAAVSLSLIFVFRENI